MEDQDSPGTEEDSDYGPNEGQREIPFNASKSVGWAESATEKKSGTSKVNHPPTGDGLDAGRKNGVDECNRDITPIDLSARQLGPIGPTRIG